MKLRTLVILSLGGLAVLTIISYMIISNSLRDDSQAEKDLSTLSSKVNSYFTKNNKLPEKLEELQPGSRLQGRLDRYDYNKKGPSKYEICANFKRPGQSTDTDYGTELESSASYSSSLSSAKSSSTYFASNPNDSSKSISTQVNSHGTGKQCFEEDADKYGYFDKYRTGKTSTSTNQTSTSTNEEY